MSPTSGASARTLRIARALSGELAGAADVTITEISPGISVNVVPRRAGARSVGWADFGSEIVVQVGEFGGRWVIAATMRTLLSLRTLSGR